ncbi:hypothetical protein [Thomasclavelia cocleata]|uniref:hypothetical protein n=1 Tax=Thomasclavelia cocleata TaxID=69824 RepID=UPI00272ABDFE|nr:hypothetical protein [Thomasclavelia cocleata]
MSEAIAVALVSGLCVAVPSVIATMVSNNKANALLQYRIDELDKKVEKHNSVVERTYLLEEKMKVANHRISDLEDKEDK